MSQANSPSRNAALQLAGTRALMLTKGSGAVVALREQGAMVCQATIGESAPPLGYRLDVASGFSGECVRTGRALRCDDSDIDPRVDGESCRQLGIRSILAAPILSGNDVVGLLEVFSPEPFAFDDACLATVERLAQSALPSVPATHATPPPKLIVEAEPALRVFFRNLVDTLSPPRLAPMRVTSLPARFWADVFVPSRLPWERFYQSMLLHVVVIAALISMIEVWQFQKNSLRPIALNQTDVIYFSPAEYREARKALAQPTSWRPRKPSSLVAAREPAIRELTAPDVKLKPELRSLHLLAWNVITPAQPLAASGQMRQGPGMGLVAVVAPPPEVGHAYSDRTVGGSTPSTVIGPPPSLRSFVGQKGAINIGHVEAVGPAPQMPGREPGISGGLRQAALHATVSSIVSPPPTVSGSGGPGAQRMATLSAAMQVALPPAVIRTNYPEKSAVAVVRDARSMDVRPSRDAISNPSEHAANNKQLSVNFVALALTLPSSSYFASDEVFIAEDRVGRDQSRLIKLVYEFLPYQTRLSDYGPNYPAVDKLRVTRDPECDEPLMQVVSSANTPAHPMSDRLRQDLKAFDQQASTLECYRTTADDYRKARARR